MDPFEIIACVLLAIMTVVTVWSVWKQDRRDDFGTNAPEKYAQEEAAAALERARKIVLDVLKIPRGWTVDELLAIVEISIIHSKPEPAPEPSKEKEIEASKCKR